MRRRIHAWQDDSTLDADTYEWKSPEAYAELPILDDEDLWTEYVTAVEAVRAARNRIMGALRMPEPLDTLELELLVAVRKEREEREQSES